MGRRFESCREYHFDLLHLNPQVRKEELKEAPDGQASYWCAGDLIEALDLAVRGAGGDRQSEGKGQRTTPMSGELVAAKLRAY